MKPSCETCILNTRVCTYATNPKKRGIQPGYIRTLELSLVWLFSQGIGAEELLKQELGIDGGDVQRLLSGKASSESELLHSHWASSIVCKQIDQLLSGTEVDSPSQDPSEVTDQGPRQSGGSALASNLSNVQIPRANSSNRRTLTQQLPSRPTSEAPGASNEAYRPLAETDSMPIDPAVEPAASAPRILRLPGNFWKLLDQYYTYTHSWLPISEKNDILKTAYSYAADGISMTSELAASGLHAELWAIIALTQCQSQDHVGLEVLNETLSNARELVPLDSSLMEIGHVKSLILITLAYLGRRAWLDAWLTVGIAIRIALHLNLHQSSAVGLRDVQHTRSKHVILACFVLEAVLCRYLNKPPHLTGKVLADIGALNEDGLEEWSPWEAHIVGTLNEHRSVSLPKQPARSLSTFNTLVHVLAKPGKRLNTPMGHSPSGFPRNSPFQLQSDAARVGSVASGLQLGNNVTTPQQVHLTLISQWVDMEAGGLTEAELLQIVQQNLRQLSSIGALFFTPPTLVPLIERLTQQANPNNPTSQAILPLTFALLNKWQQDRVPVDTAPRASTTASTETELLSSPYPRISELQTIPSLGSGKEKNAPGMQSNIELSSVLGRSAQTQIPHASSSHHAQSSMDVSAPSHTAGMQQHVTAYQQKLPSNMNLNVSNMTNFLDQASPDFYSDGGSNPADLEAIFEEIAMLDGNMQATDGSQFMQNLGVGPDLDLGAFFGADYQQSDPLLAYLQNDAYGQGIGNQNSVFPGS